MPAWIKMPKKVSFSPYLSLFFFPSLLDTELLVWILTPGAKDEFKWPVGTV